MAILDLYKNSTSDYKNAGAAVNTTTAEQQWVANKTFDVNLTPGDKIKTEFNMVDSKSNTTNNKFDSYNVNSAGYNPTKKYNDGQLTGK